MTTITWVLQGLLGFVFLAAGGLKLAQTREKVIQNGGKWAEDFSQPMIKLIGLVEVLIALGLVVPRLLDLSMAATLTMAAAAGVMVVMGGAFVTHIKRKEPPFLAVTGTIFILGASLAWFTGPGAH